jgi:hypothetical protein
MNQTYIHTYIHAYIHTHTHNSRAWHSGARHEAHEPFLPALLAAFAQRSECQHLLRMTLTPAIDELRSILEQTSAQNAWGDLEATTRDRDQGRVSPSSVPSRAAVQVAQVILESLASEASLRIIPLSLIQLCAALHTHGGVEAVSEMIIDVLVIPYVSDLAFYFGECVLNVKRSSDVGHVSGPSSPYATVNPSSPSAALTNEFRPSELDHDDGGLEPAAVQVLELRCENVTRVLRLAISPPSGVYSVLFNT